MKSFIKTVGPTLFALALFTVVAQFSTTPAKAQNKPGQGLAGAVILAGQENWQDGQPHNYGVYIISTSRGVTAMAPGTDLAAALGFYLEHGFHVQSSQGLTYTLIR